MDVMRTAAGLLMLLLCAAAPPPGSSDAIDLAPYGDWIEHLQIPGTNSSCCSKSDCREVLWRIKGGRYEAFIDERWIDSTNSWEVVPASAVIPPAKRGPISMACWVWSHLPSRFLCFSPGFEN
jgi:hypothetical protein